MRSSSVQAIEKPAEIATPVLAGRPYAEPEQWSAVDLHQLIAMLRRRKWVILGVFASVIGLALLYAVTAKPIFESQATIEINTQNRSGASSDLAIIGLLPDIGTRSVETQVAILKGAPLQNKALEHLTDRQRRIAKSFKAIDVAGVGDTDLVRIAVRTRDREASQKLADGLCREYISDSLEQNRNQVRGARVYVQDQLKKQLGRLNQAQIQLANFKKRHATFDLTAQSQALVTRMTALQAEAQQARSDKLSATAQLSQLRATVSGMPDSTRTPTTETRSPKVEALKSQLTQTEIELLKAQQEYTPNDPTIIALKNQIAGLRRQLKNQVEFETSTIANVPNDMKRSLQQQMAQLEGVAVASEARGVAVARAINAARTELKTLPDREYQLGRLTQEASGLLQAYNLLNEQYQNLMIQEQAKVANAQQRFPANRATLVAPKKMRILMMAVPMGLILALVLAAFVDRIDGRVHSDSEVESATGLPVMAHIPDIARSEDSKLLGASMDESNFQLAESFQMLRTGISFSVYDKPIRSVLISSALPGEGKSTCAMNLAIAAAQSGERVILVDCDLRRPSAHRLMKLSNRVGFTSVVAGTATLEEALQETSVPGLRILSSGPTPPNPYRMLHSRGARELLEQLRREADFVVIDTPPALGMADAQLVSSSADAILLVVSTKGAKKHEIARTRDLLGQTNIEVLGSILNRVQAGFAGYYGQTSYGAYALPQADGKDTHNGSHDGALNGSGPVSHETANSKDA